MHCTGALPVFIISSGQVIVAEDPNRHSPIYIMFRVFPFKIDIPDVSWIQQPIIFYYLATMLLESPCW
jgi:hypothetical protein